MQLRTIATQMRYSEGGQAQIRYIKCIKSSCCQEHQVQTSMNHIQLHNFIIHNEITPPRVNSNNNNTIISSWLKLQSRTLATQMSYSEGEQAQIRYIKCIQSSCRQEHQVQTSMNHIQLHNLVIHHATIPPRVNSNNNKQ